MDLHNDNDDQNQIKKRPHHLLIKSFFYRQLQFCLGMYKIVLEKSLKWNSVALFLLVGFLGFCLNMAILTIALWGGMDVKIAIILGITASTTLLFALDRHFVFSHARHKSVTPQLIGFLIACLIGGMFNYYATTFLLTEFSWLMPQVAEIFGLIVGAIFNYFFLRYLVFKK